jgi:hypothetical protein
VRDECTPNPPLNWSKTAQVNKSLIFSVIPPMRDAPCKKRMAALTSGEVMLNHILSALDRADYAQLSSYLEPCQLDPRRELESPNRRINNVYFVESGIAAVLSVSKPHRIAVGLIGCEGASGISTFLGDDRSPHSTVCSATAQRSALQSARFAVQWISNPT